MTPDKRENQNDPFRPIQRPLINSSNVEAYRLTLLDSLSTASGTCRTVGEWAAPARESGDQAGFDRDQFIEKLSAVLRNRLHSIQQRLDVALEWQKKGSHGAEHASIATGYVNWEYFKWIVDFQKVPPPTGHQTCPDCKLFRPDGIQPKCRSCDETESASKWIACLLGRPLDLHDFHPMGEGQPRHRYASDCAVRALNEAIDGSSYGEIWNAITQGIRSLGYSVDADQGANWSAIHQIYESHGLRLIYEDDKISHLFHRRLIDMREVSSVLAPLFAEHQKPLIYTVGTDVHYVTVYNGAIRDAWDSRRMGERDQLGRAGRVKFLWIKSDDDELTEKAPARFNSYAFARGHDRALLPWQ
jgi:hypothetical protein